MALAIDKQRALAFKFYANLLVTAIIMYVASLFYVGIQAAFMMFYAWYVLCGGGLFFVLIFTNDWRAAGYFALFWLITAVLSVFVFPKMQDFGYWLCLGPKTRFPESLLLLRKPLCHIR